MTTLIGMVSDKNEPAVILASDLSGTRPVWNTQGDVAYRKQMRYENQKIYIDDKREFAISATGLIDQIHRSFINAVLSGKTDVRKAVESGFFKEVLDMHLRRWDGRIPDSDMLNSFLIATRFDNKPELYTCYPLGKVEGRYWTSIGSGSEYALEYIGKSDKMVQRVTPDEAIDLAVGGLDAASQDVYTSGLDLVIVRTNGINQFGDKIRDSLKESKRKTVESIKKELQTTK